MSDEAASRTGSGSGVRTQRYRHAKSPSAQAFDDWVDVVFGAAQRIVRGVAPVAVLVFAGIELVNPGALGQHHISAELAQTLLGASLGALGMDLISRKGGRR
jgi:hypothetical protein